MSQVIIYKQDSGIVAVIYPTGDLTIEQVALKDVPHGVPFLIVDEADVPSDRTFRSAWEADFSSPDGYGMGAHRWLIQQAESVLAELAAAPVPPEFTPADTVSADDPMWQAAKEAHGWSDEETAAQYAQYVASVESANAAAEASYRKQTDAWLAQHNSAVRQQHDIIAGLKAEVLKIEGVEL